MHRGVLVGSEALQFKGKEDFARHIRERKLAFLEFL